MSRFFLSLPALLVLALPALAGTELQPSESVGGTFATPLPPSVQEDIGNIRPVSETPISSYFHGQAQVNMGYIANADLYHGLNRPDFLVNPELRGGFTAPLGKGFTIDLNAEFNDVTYAGNQDLGFLGFDGVADLQYRFKPTWPKIYAGVEPYYYWGYDTGERLTSAIGPIVGIEQTISLDRGKTLLLFGYHFGDYFSDPSIDTRQSHTASVAITQQLRRDLYVQLYYQWQYSIYTQAGRDESRQMIGTSLIYQFNPHLFASFYVNYVDNWSDSDLAKYQNVNAGISLTLQY